MSPRCAPTIKYKTKLTNETKDKGAKGYEQTSFVVKTHINENQDFNSCDMRLN